MDAIDLRVRILGRVTVTRSGEPIRLPPRPLAVLGLAALSDTGKVSFSRLREVFGSARDTPRTETLRGYVSELRTALGGLMVVPTAREGTVSLRVARENIDFQRYRRLTAEARGRADEVRLSLIRQALDLWCAEKPLSGLGDAHVDDEVDRLDLLHRSTVLDLIATELRDRGRGRDRGCGGCVRSVARRREDRPATLGRAGPRRP